MSEHVRVLGPKYRAAATLLVALVALLAVAAVAISALDARIAKAVEPVAGRVREHDDALRGLTETVGEIRADVRVLRDRSDRAAKE